MKARKLPLIPFTLDADNEGAAHKVRKTHSKKIWVDSNAKRIPIQVESRAEIVEELLKFGRNKLVGKSFEDFTPTFKFEDVPQDLGKPVEQDEEKPRKRGRFDYNY
jgi:hypothetical protein